MRRVVLVLGRAAAAIAVFFAVLALWNLAVVRWQQSHVKVPGHTVFKDRPDLVVAEITLLINYLRGGPAPPFGTTTIQ